MYAKVDTVYTSKTMRSFWRETTSDVVESFADDGATVSTIDEETEDADGGFDCCEAFAPPDTTAVVCDCVAVDVVALVTDRDGLGVFSPVPWEGKGS